MIQFRSTPFLFSVISLSLALFVLSCDGGVDTATVPFVPVSDLQIQVKVSSGELFSTNQQEFRVPTFFNVGQLDTNTYTIILGKSVNGGEKIAYTPIGMYTLEIDAIDYTFIIGKPDAQDLQIFEASTYNEFSLNEIQLKALIDSWFKTNCEDFSCSNLSWQNDLKALRKLEHYQLNK